MRRLFPVLLFASAAVPYLPAGAAPAPVAALVSEVKVPFDEFTLPNGLRVIVHTDRKAPIVAVSVWYHIGSKDEPAGKTGFAHLFENLMFYGSENDPKGFLQSLNDLGATDSNGTTWFDRTNYFESVPTAALDRALFLESDRMGYLLGAVTQGKLDAQRGVVQNEKRQGDNQPLGLTEYVKLAALFPDGHPYRHSTIGSMADLDAASMTDVRGWFRANYGPNNAVLVLAGDIDLASAKRLTAKYFGAIARGPDVKRYDAPVPRWTQTRRETLNDQVPTTNISYNWVAPGINDAASRQIDVALTILAGGASSRLYNDLVRDKKLAVSLSGGNQVFEKVSMPSIDVTLAPGADPKAVEARIDAAIAEFVANGPTADEVSRVATRAVAGTIRGLESVGGFGGKAVTLAEGAVYSGNPGAFRTMLGDYANATPASVQAAAREWLARGDYRLTVLPGARPPAESNTPATKTPPPAPPVTVVARMADPGLGTPAPLVFPAVERATLSNGIAVELVQRRDLPLVRLSMAFDAGYGADDRQLLGIQGLTLGLLDEGADGLTGPQIAEARERLGAGIGGGASFDVTRLTLDALKPNLDASVALYAGIVQRPDFPVAELERVRGQILTGIKQEESNPQAIARRLLGPELYGPAHPYGVPGTGTGTTAGVTAVTRGDIIAWHKRWLRPDTARMFVVGDVTMAELKPMLEKHFGGWRSDAAVPRGTKTFVAVPAPRPRIILVDRPGSPQSVIRGGLVLPLLGKDDPQALRQANYALGGDTASRLSMNLRETKNWSYGAYSSLGDQIDRISWVVQAPVQSDKTGASLKELIAEIKAVGTTRPIDTKERDTAINGAILTLPGDFETGGAMLGAIERNALLGRGDDYYAKLVPRLRSLTPAALNKETGLLDAGAMTWVVVGDRKTVEPQLKDLGLPIEVR
ncbi:pitrilysin family protein [Sandarakinorhabdus sp.]|uniref:M16 family metallopeptidase n=1 Tax=Sandarakinorhabdus sp. TaxID=1916663 RepID=UPI00286DFA9A|nr:pitrilysin family protein [Sandarakinorhabdus sp.]